MQKRLGTVFDYLQLLEKCSLHSVVVFSAIALEQETPGFESK